MSKAINLENWLFGWACVLGFVPTFMLVWALWLSPLLWATTVLIGLIMSCCVLFIAYRLRQKVVHYLQTNNNMLDAILRGDSSLKLPRARGALQEQNQLLNTFAGHLAQQRLVSKEQHLLLNKVSQHIDVAIIALDHSENISLMNPAAEKLFHLSSEQWLGWPVKQLGIEVALNQTQPQLMNLCREQSNRQVYVSCDQYADQGKVHHLIFIHDIQHILHEEERTAWQRLLRVLNHEINNSLTPISAISQALSKQLGQVVNNGDFSKYADVDKTELEDMQEGLAVIRERATGLHQFMKSYQSLTKLPAPDKQYCDIKAIIETTCALFDETVELRGGAHQLFIDSTQIQQVLINLFKNAIEASESLGGDSQTSTTRVSIEWYIQNNQLHIQIIDSGQGIQNPDNLFVPFYSTKQHGAGIGLVLSRQIIRNHGGDLHLSNRKDARGAVVNVTLPC